MTPLIETLKSIGGWPLVGQKTNYIEEKFSWQDSLARILGVLNIGSIFAINVQSDANDTMVNRVYVRNLKLQC